MISFDTGLGAFNYRAAAVCIHDGHALLHKFAGDDFWALPGGRVEFGETAERAVARELGEELGAAREPRVERLLWVVENYFTHQGTRNHELGLYYLVSFAPHATIYDTTREHIGIEDTGHDGLPLKLIFRWFPLDRLAGERIYPTFLRERLRALPATVEHIVHIDPSEYCVSSPA